MTGDTVSTTSVDRYIDNILLEFGSVWVDVTRLFITNPSFGAAIVSISGEFAQQKAHIPIEGQVTVCWSTYDKMGGKAYSIDAGTNVIKSCLRCEWPTVWQHFGLLAGATAAA